MIEISDNELLYMHACKIAVESITEILEKEGKISMGMLKACLQIVEDEKRLSNVGASDSQSN